MGKFSMKEFLNEQSKAEAPPGRASGFEIQNIPIDKIIPSPSNFYNIRDIEELAASIEEFGLLHNLVVKESCENGLFELVSGERRYRACELLFKGGNAHFSTVPCRVQGGESPEMDELKLIHANATARVLTDYEKTTQAGRIKELLQQMKVGGHKFKGRMRDIVAEMLKVSPAQIGRMESINKNLSPELKEAFEGGEIGISKAYEASLMKPEEQAAALDNFKATGELSTARPPAPPPDYEPQVDYDLLKADVAAMEKEEYIEPKQAYAYLVDVDGGKFEVEGNLVMIAAVNDDMGLDGAMSTGENHALEFIMLASSLVGECIARLVDSGAGERLESLKNTLLLLFDEIDQNCEMRGYYGQKTD